MTQDKEKDNSKNITIFIREEDEYYDNSSIEEFAQFIDSLLAPAVNKFVLDHTNNQYSPCVAILKDVEVNADIIDQDTKNTSIRGLQVVLTLQQDDDDNIDRESDYNI